MSERANESLVLAASALARSAPAAWDEFVTELAHHARDRASECVRATTDTVFLVQGRARHAAELYDLLKDCRSTAHKISERKK